MKYSKELSVIGAKSKLEAVVRVEKQAWDPSYRASSAVFIC